MQAFKTAGKLFSVIDAQTEEIIVPYDKCAKELILELNSDQTSYEIMKKLRSAQKYIVSIYSNQKNSKKILRSKITAQPFPYILK